MIFKRSVHWYWSAWPLRGLVISAISYVVWNRYGEIDADLALLAILSVLVQEVLILDLLLRYTGVFKQSLIDLIYVAHPLLEAPPFYHNKIFETSWVILTMIFASVPFQILNRMASQQ